MSTKYRERRAAGHCPQCGGERTEANRINCASCREKSRQRNNAYYAGAGKAKVQANTRKRHLKATYGLTPSMYAGLVARQEGRCAICGKAYPKLRVDHEHTTGNIRGLLCASCNTGLGLLGDTKAGLLRALAYLMEYEHAAYGPPVRWDEA